MSEAGPVPEQKTKKIDHGFDLMEVILLFSQHLRIILAWAAMGALVFSLYAFHLHRAYTAQSSFLLNDNEQISASRGRRADPTLSLLRSRTLTNVLVRQQNLRNTFPAGATDQDINGVIVGETSVFPMDDGVIIIIVRDTDPKRAVQLANGYLVALQTINETNNLQSAEHRRKFFQTQVDLEHELLDKAELQLKELQERTGLVQPGSQTGSELGTIAGLKGQIAGRQVALASAMQGATEQNPNIIRLRTEIAALTAQQRRAESQFAPQTNTSNLPTKNLEYIRLQREVSFHETLVQELAREYQSAHMDASYLSSHIRTVDEAVLPRFPSWPPHRSIIMVGLGIGFLVGLLNVCLIILIGRYMKSEENRSHLRKIRQAVWNGLLFKH